jgi:hypothetical protein
MGRKSRRCGLRAVSETGYRGRARGLQKDPAKARKPLIHAQNQYFWEARSQRLSTRMDQGTEQFLRGNGAPETTSSQVGARLPAIAVGQLALRGLADPVRKQARSYKGRARNVSAGDAAGAISCCINPCSSQASGYLTRHKYFKTLLSDHLASCTMTYDISAGLVLHPQK